MTQTVLAILAMGAVTYATRLAGWLLLRHARPTGRLAAGLDALPGAVLVAVIAPIIVQGGPPEWIGTAAVILAARRLPTWVTIALGVALVAALRQVQTLGLGWPL
jgi:uncharacterized membrane protein